MIFKYNNTEFKTYSAKSKEFLFTADYQQSLTSEKWSNLLSENLSLFLQDVIVGILNKKDILNYLIILSKLYILHKVEAKRETERLITSRNKKLQDFRKRWELLS
ncbi:hypothetical protein pdam_00018947 [Pocillopora damicornis]|uniref:Uncharacterized protein n=1 Tax=Pocillopora damicornis TaxID=46731 RepID=A0A3M6UNR0_POCDA|nr:hypothetical protein pdam_00018947 [Pocillopora damicornis]